MLHGGPLFTTGHTSCHFSNFQKSRFSQKWPKTTGKCLFQNILRALFPTKTCMMHNTSKDFGHITAPYRPGDDKPRRHYSQLCAVTYSSWINDANFKAIHTRGLNVQWYPPPLISPLCGIINNVRAGGEQRRIHPGLNQQAEEASLAYGGPGYGMEGEGGVYVIDAVQDLKPQYRSRTYGNNRIIRGNYNIRTNWTTTEPNQTKPYRKGLLDTSTPPSLYREYNNSLHKPTASLWNTWFTTEKNVFQCCYHFYINFFSQIPT